MYSYINIDRFNKKYFPLQVFRKLNERDFLEKKIKQKHVIEVHNNNYIEDKQTVKSKNVIQNNSRLKMKCFENKNKKNLLHQLNMSHKFKKMINNKKIRVQINSC